MNLTTKLRKLTNTTASLPEILAIFAMACGCLTLAILAGLIISTF